jgi:hypothetical protein
MKFYETHFEEYLKAVEKNNFHPDKLKIYNHLSFHIPSLSNLIFYGPTGVGKYSQVLLFLKKYSPSQLTYEKKIDLEIEKQKYNYKISDVHYEIDMAILGCNSKLIWHEIFSQIIDIISNNMKTRKVGFIVCKNFHSIHNELLDIFYSYIQQYRNTNTSPITIRFILITEHISFLPKNIIQCCKIISFSRPSKAQYLQFIEESEASVGGNTLPVLPTSSPNIFNSVEPANIVNIKELKSFSLIKNTNSIPEDIFNVICNKIIQEMLNPEKIVYMDFRDKIYDILIYNLDVIDCIWYILSNIIYTKQGNGLKKEDITDILDKVFVFLKYYNNNYRPIYHLESILFTIIIKINGYDNRTDELFNGQANIGV